MTRQEIPRAPEGEVCEQGQWMPYGGTVLLACPGCGVRSLMSDHTIAADGTVTPSVGCPNDCGYHEFVKLADYP